MLTKRRNDEERCVRSPNFSERRHGRQRCCVDNHAAARAGAGYQTGAGANLFFEGRNFNPVISAGGTNVNASCQAILIGDTDMSPVPIRQFHGTADDYVPVAPCRAYFERLRGAGRDVQLTEFPDAHHSYDNPLGNKTPTVSKGAQSVRACKLKEEPLGTIINAETGQPFTYEDPCVQSDPHTGYNEPAANATRKAVKDFVRTVFKLER